MTYTAEITVNEDPEEIYKCLLPEKISRERSTLTLKKENGRLVIKAEAKEEAREQFRLIENVPDPSLEDGFNHIFAEMPTQLQMQLKQRRELTQE